MARRVCLWYLCSWLCVSLSVLFGDGCSARVTLAFSGQRYFGACKQKGVVPATDCAADGEGLGRLRAILSTGSPLLPEHFQWIYQVRVLQSYVRKRRRIVDRAGWGAQSAVRDGWSRWWKTLPVSLTLCPARSSLPLV